MEKTATRRGPIASWVKLVHLYQTLPYSYQRVVEDVLKPMIGENTKTFLNKKIVREFCHELLQGEMQKKGMSYTELYEEMNCRENYQLSMKTYESFRKDKTINSYLFKDACDILDIPYFEKKVKRDNGTDKSYIVLQALCDTIEETNKRPKKISVPTKASINEMKKDKKWDEKKIKYENKTLSFVGHYCDFLHEQENLINNNIEWVFKLLNANERQIIEALLNSLQQLAFDESTK